MLMGKEEGTRIRSSENGGVVREIEHGMLRENGAMEAGERGAVRGERGEREGGGEVQVRG